MFCVTTAVYMAPAAPGGLGPDAPRSAFACGYSIFRGRIEKTPPCAVQKKGVRQNFFRRPGPLLMIQAVLRAEIRDALSHETPALPKNTALCACSNNSFSRCSILLPPFLSGGSAAAGLCCAREHTRRTPEGPATHAPVHLYAVHAVPPHHAAAGKPKVFAPQHFS